MPARPKRPSASSGCSTDGWSPEESVMIRNYLTLAWKVLLRRKFFTFISLFGVSFTLVVLLLVTALVDHVVAGYPPETKHASTVNIAYSMLKGEHSRRNGFAGFGLLDKYAR